MDHIKLYALLVLLSPLAAQPWIEAVMHRSMPLQKSGQLVDAQSGAPIADAVVVFHWIDTGDSGGCVLQRATTTDGNGQFMLPDVSSLVSFRRTWLDTIGATISLYGRNPTTYYWTLIAYAPGFAMESPNQPGKVPPVLIYKITNPSGGTSNSTLTLQPIKVVRTSFSPTDEISYQGRVRASLQCGFPGENPPEVVHASEQIAERARPLPCAIPEDTPMKATLLAEYATALGDREVVRALADAAGEHLGPAAWQHDLPAGVVCRAADSEAGNHRR